jgi:hypothetical protein
MYLLCVKLKKLLQFRLSLEMLEYNAAEVRVHQPRRRNAELWRTESVNLPQRRAGGEQRAAVGGRSRGRKFNGENFGCVEGLKIGRSGLDIDFAAYFIGAEDQIHGLVMPSEVSNGISGNHGDVALG